MRAINYGDVKSQRGAQILVYDPNKKFDPSRSEIGTTRAVGTGATRTKDFQYAQKARTGNFLTRAFGGSKANAAASKDFATKEALSRGKYEIPNAEKGAESKIATTKSLWDGDKVAATRDLHDGNRLFLGPESKKLGTSMDPKTMADWRSGGNETVSYANGTVERIGNLKQLSIDDVRELLNKNK